MESIYHTHLFNLIMAFKPCKMCIVAPDGYIGPQRSSGHSDICPHKFLADLFDEFDINVAMKILMIAAETQPKIIAVYRELVDEAIHAHMGSNDPGWRAMARVLEGGNLSEMPSFAFGYKFIRRVAVRAMMYPVLCSNGTLGFILNSGYLGATTCAVLHVRTFLVDAPVYEDRSYRTKEERGCGCMAMERPARLDVSVNTIVPAPEFNFGSFKINSCAVNRFKTSDVALGILPHDFNAEKRVVMEKLPRGKFYTKETGDPVEFIVDWVKRTRRSDYDENTPIGAAGKPSSPVSPRMFAGSTFQAWIVYKSGWKVKANIRFSKMGLWCVVESEKGAFFLIQGDTFRMQDRCIVLRENNAMPIYHSPANNKMIDAIINDP